LLCLFYGKSVRFLFRLSRRLLQIFPEQGLGPADSAARNVF